MKKIRFGIVGTNFISDWLLEGASEDSRFEASAVMSRSQERGEEFASRHGIPYVFTNLSEMLASGTVDAVYIASPNCCHSAQSIACMRAGKHVLCEKPLASNAVEAKSMVEEARCNGVALMEAMKPTMSPNFKALSDNIGRVGTVRRYFASYCQYSSRYDRLKAGELPNAFNPALSNGAIMDIGVYTIYPMVVLFGKPRSVKATGMLLPSGVDGQGAVSFGYDEMDAAVIYSKIADSRLRSEIQGEDGILSMANINHMEGLRFIPRTANLGGGLRQDAAEMSIDVHPGKNEYYYEVAEFIDLIEAGKIESAVNSHAASVATLEILDEIRRQLGVKFPADEVSG